MAEIGSGAGMDDVATLVEEVARLRAELAYERRRATRAEADLNCLVKWAEGAVAGTASLLGSLGFERPDHGEEGFADPVIDLRIVDERIAP